MKIGHKRGTMKLLFPNIKAVLLASTCLTLTACDEATHGDSKTSPPEVGIYTVQPQEVQLSTELPGRTNAFLIAEVRPQVGGLLLKREFREGSYVEAGQILYQIDPAPYRATLAHAEASLESSRLLFKRYERLLATHFVSQQQYDDARSQYMQAKADAESARINVGYTQITAPISGRIGRSTVTQGALVTASQSNPLATIQQIDPIYVDITQPATALLQLKEDLASGQLKSSGKEQAEVNVKLDSGRLYPHKGTLQFSEVSVDESTGAVTLRAVIPNPEGTLLPGMFVRAWLQEGIREQALLIPQRGITRDTQGQAMALVVDEQDIVKRRSVVTERSVDGHWLIRAGLQAGDRVVVDGIQKVQPDMRVKSVPVSAISSREIPPLRADIGK